MATIAHFDIENVKPQENVPQAIEALALKSKAEALAAPVKPVEMPPADHPEEEEAEDEAEEDEDYEDEESEEEDEDIAEEEGEEIYPEDELSVEVDAPLSLDVEAKEAAELAKALGFDTDSALSHLGQLEKRVGSTLNTYSALISADTETAQLYDGLTTEINNLRTAFDEGIRKMATESEIKMSAGAVDVIRTLAEQYLRTVVERSVVHSEYRESARVVVNDILTVLNIMGRPLYWKGPTEESTEDMHQSVDGDAMEEDAMEEEDEEFSEEEAEEVEMEQTEEAEEDTCFAVAAFKRMVDVINRWDSEFSVESYSCLQATTEDYIVSLVQASSRSSHFAGRTEVTDDDVRFAQLMTQQKW